MNTVELTWDCDTYQNSGNSGENSGILEIRSIWPTLYLWGHSTSMVHPMGLVWVRFISIPPENRIPPSIGQNDLLSEWEP